MIDVVYIAGWGRSGSTALERELQRYVGICGVGELQYVWERGWIRDEVCACGQHFSQCAFWRPVIETARARVPLPPRHLKTQQRALATVPKLVVASNWRNGKRTIASYVQALDAVVTAAAEVSGASVIVDSSKSAAHMMLLAQCPSVRLHVVHLVRDPVAVARSWSAAKSRPESAGEQPFMTRIGWPKSAAHWLVHNYAAEALGGSAASYQLVSHADMLQAGAADTAAEVLRGLDRFGGRDQKSSEDWHSVSGNPLRFETGSGLPGAAAPRQSPRAESMIRLVTTVGRRRWLE